MTLSIKESSFSAETSTTLADRVERLKQLSSMLENRGLRVAPTRISNYIKILDKFAFQTFRNQIENIEEITHSLMEADELLWIFEGLKIASPPGIYEVLEKSVGGAVYTKNEHGKNRARNFQLELRIASYFIQVGIKVDLSKESDLVASINGKTLHVECKRLESTKKVIVRFKESYKQLKRRYKQDGILKKTYGLVVFDISKIVKPRQDISVGSSSIAIRNEIRRSLKDFDLQYDCTPIFIKDKRLISIWYQAIIPALPLSRIEPSTRFSSLHTRCVPSVGPRASIYNSLKKVFEIY